MQRFMFAGALVALAACTGPTETTALQMKVEGMSCESCAQAIVAELELIEGVRAAEVDVDKGLASIVVPAAQAEALRAPLEEAVDSLGYEASFD